jgi:hypothetical protein
MDLDVTDFPLIHVACSEVQPNMAEMEPEDTESGLIYS